MVDKMRRTSSKTADISHPRICSTVRVDLPTFAIVALRKRARDGGASVSSLVERLVLENLMVDELQAMIAESPDFARAFSAWFRHATTRRT